MKKIKKGDIFVYNDNILECKGVYKVNTVNNHILTTNIGRNIKQPKLEDMKVKIGDKELCNGADWNDFLKAVEEKEQENKQLKEQLAEKDKEIERLKQCVMSREQVEAILKPKIADLTKRLTKKITPIIMKECSHQICDEIREYIKQFESITNAPHYYPIMQVPLHTFLNHLDQIEKGEKENGFIDN